jgi:hypothetical protein
VHAFGCSILKTSSTLQGSKRHCSPVNGAMPMRVGVSPLYSARLPSVRAMVCTASQMPAAHMATQKGNIDLPVRTDNRALRCRKQILRAHLCRGCWEVPTASEPHPADASAWWLSSQRRHPPSAVVAPSLVYVRKACIGRVKEAMLRISGILTAAADIGCHGQ